MIDTSEPLGYRDGGADLAGLLVRPSTDAQARPALLLIHGGAGLDEHAREQAHRWASEGHLVLAADMFGAEVAGDRERIMACLREFRDDPARLVQRVRAGLTALAARTPAGRPGLEVPPAVLGYCFGGMAALAVARSGQELTAAVSIHGSLATPAPAEPGGLRCPVLVCHGAADPHVPLAQVTDFAAEMESARADWQLIMYGGAEHGFTHRHARPGAQPGVAYQARADHESFAAARHFIQDAVRRRAEGGGGAVGEPDT